MSGVFGGVLDGFLGAFDFVSGVNDGNLWNLYFQNNAVRKHKIMFPLMMCLQSLWSDTRMENATARSFSSKQMPQLLIGPFT